MPMQAGDLARIVSKLDYALTSIFSEDGKRTVMYYMGTKFGLTLEKATVDPEGLEAALTDMLGKIGWMVVKKAILEEFGGRRIELHDTALVERASLREAFGLLRGQSFGMSLAL